jgi:hypothetical protein
MRSRWCIEIRQAATKRMVLGVYNEVWLAIVVQAISGPRQLVVQQGEKNMIRKKQL